MAFPYKPRFWNLIAVKSDPTFSQPYDQIYHHPASQSEQGYGYHKYTTASWRKPNKDTPPEKIDPKTGLVKIPDHNARDVALPKRSVAVAPADCKVIWFGKGGEKNGGWMKLEFYLADDSGKPKKYTMQLAHIDDFQVKKGSIIPKGTVLGTAHHISRVGKTMLCIRVHDEHKKPVDYLKIIGARTLPVPLPKIEVAEQKKTLVN